MTDTDIEKIFLTSALTIVGGLLIYVTGQLLSKTFIELTYELKKTIGEVRFNLAFHCTVIRTPMSRTVERSEKAYESIMKSSCDLLARVNAIPCYTRLSWLFPGFLPSRQAIVEAANYLRELSTYVNEQEVDKASHSIERVNKLVARIEKNLGLEPLT